ncbi:MAG: PorT family protein [Prevotella sp.]|jgi:opacity protein-like surface antigen|nr:PorT family protein [Prevotella sp.]
MKTFRVILFAAVCLIAINMNAQEKKTTFGIKLGLNICDLSASDGRDFDNTKSKTGLLAGITLDYAFTHQWYLMTGLEYSSKGVKIDMGGSEDMSVTAAYAQLPVCAGFKYSVNETLAIVAKLGPYFAYGLHGKTKMGSYEEDTFSDEVAKNFDCGIHFGAGVEYQKFNFMLGGESGMVNIMQANNTKAETRNFALSVGYKF